MLHDQRLQELDKRKQGQDFDPVWASGAAYKVSFNGDGQELMHRDEVLPPSCMLGVRIAAGAIFGCDIVTMTKLPDHYLQRFTLAAVMGYLATQQRESLSLDADSLVLQLITVDELQLASRQAQLRHLDIDPGFPNSMVNVLGKWMTAGSGRHVGICVLMGLGLRMLGLVCHVTNSSLGQ